jgi:hypothetical protein
MIHLFNNPIGSIQPTIDESVIQARLALTDGFIHAFFIQFRSPPLV